MRVNAPLDNAPIDDDRQSRRRAEGGGSGRQTGKASQAKSKLAAADEHASIVEWETCRKSW
jgi:hypothetical protein